jgi:hypothetical protein
LRPAVLSQRALDARSGIKTGLGFATVYSAFALGMALLRGSTDYDRIGITTWQVIGFYHLAGIGGGAIFGLLLLAPLYVRVFRDQAE